MAPKDPLAVAVGRAVRRAIEDAGLTQADAGDSIGLSKRSMSRRITGHLPFTWPELVRVSDVVDVDLSDLLEDAERTAARVAAAADTSAPPTCEFEGAA